MVNWWYTTSFPCWASGWRQRYQRFAQQVSPSSHSTLNLQSTNLTLNRYESDASPTRPDLYQAGNDYMTQADQFNDLIATSPGGSVDLNSLTNFRSKRFDQQIASNPYFFNGPFTGVAVQPAAYTFIYRFMANHSEANPYGLLDYDVLASWFGMTGETGAYTANQGMEKIPMNWYRRALEYPYDQGYFVADLANAAALHPKFLDVGG